MEAYLADRRAQFEQEGKSAVLADYIFEEEEIQLDSIQLDDLKPIILKLDDFKVKVQDPL